MINKFSLALIVCFSSSIAFAQITFIDSIWVNNTYRSYKLYFPPVYNPAVPTPVVFDFHGYGGNYNLIGNFESIADTANFIIVAPQGDSVPLLSFYYPGWNCFGPVADFDKDKTFISNLIDSLHIQFNINLDKVYACGISNGGFMSYDLACFLSERFAAIASVAGSITPVHYNACSPQHPMPVMEIHGTGDTIVYYNGNTIPGFESEHIDSLVVHWLNFNHCSPIPDYSDVFNINPLDGCHAQHFVFNGGYNGSSVELYKVIDGGHTWPGSGFNLFGPVTCMDFSASVEIWRFFRKYALSSLSTGINDLKDKNELNINIFPNPGNGLFVLKASQLINSIIITNMLSETIYSFQPNSIEQKIDLSTIKSGVYFINISSTNGKSVIKRIIIE